MNSRAESRRKKVKSANTKQRRRAQNRASQRAFRDRKEKHVKEVEARLQELEGKYSDLSQSYETLQTEYVRAKQQLDKLNVEEGARDSQSSSSPRDSLFLVDGEFDGAVDQDLSSILFENELLCFEMAHR